MKAKIEKQDNLRFDGVKFYSVHFDILGIPKEYRDRFRYFSKGNV